MDSATANGSAERGGAPERQRQIGRRRDLLRHASAYVAGLTVAPPFPQQQLMRMARELAARIGVSDETEAKLLAILIHNEAWRETVAGVPFGRRLLLLPQCLRPRHVCPAGRDAFGLLCEACGRCVLGDLQREATALGYAVLIAEGTETAAGLLQAGKLDAVIGVSCLAALEKTFLRIADEALPALAVPLLRDGCDHTDVDIELLFESIRLCGPAATPPDFSLEDVRASVQGWFEPEALRSLLGTETGESRELALAWLAGSGKRWRPLLTASVYRALLGPNGPPERIRAVAVAAECFHKASLIHDDIEDNDDFRYGVPTVHKAHGVPVALNVGDLLIGDGYRLLATAPAEESVRLRMLTAAARAHCRLCVGQGDELQWRKRSEVPPSADVIRLFGRKTAPAFEVAILLGALAGGADDDACAPLAAFSRALGIAYQIGDDLQDVEQDGPGGRTPGQHPSILLALLCEVCTPAERGDILDALKRAPPGAGARGTAAALIARYGVAAAAEALREHYRGLALQALTPVRSVRLKSVLTRLVKRIVSPTERAPHALA